MKISHFYTQKADDVAKHKGLEYIRKEKMIRFLLAAGRVPQDDYVYWAERLVEDVLSEPDEEQWLELYKQYRLKMHREERGTGVIEYIGISPWRDLFQAFYFASPRWEKTKRSQNYLNLVRFYAKITSQERGKKSSDFSMDFIHETFSLWEGLRDGDPLAAFADFVCSKRCTGNWNDYLVFFQYVRASILAVYYAGYIEYFDVWKLEGLEKGKNEKQYLQVWKSLTVEAVQDTVRELRKNQSVLEMYADYLPQEKEHYESFLALMNYYAEVMASPKAGIYHESAGVQTSIHSPSREAYQAVAQIEDEAEFREKVNAMPEHLSVAECIRLIRERYRKD